MDDLPILKIASPCSVKWEQMSGNERVRRCAQCDHDVFDFRSMSSNGIAELLRQHSGEKICARLFQRSDGTILTKDCPEARQTKVRYVSRIAGVALGAALSLSPAVAQTPGDATPVTKPAVRTTGLALRVTDQTGKNLAGVQITVKTREGDNVRDGLTGADGKFEALGLKPGHYIVDFSEANGLFLPSVRVSVKKDKVTSFTKEAFGPFVGEITSKPVPEIKPKG